MNRTPTTSRNHRVDQSMKSIRVQLLGTSHSQRSSVVSGRVALGPVLAQQRRADLRPHRVGLGLQLGLHLAGQGSSRPRRRPSGAGWLCTPAAGRPPSAAASPCPRPSSAGAPCPRLLRPRAAAHASATRPRPSRPTLAGVHVLVGQPAVEPRLGLLRRSSSTFGLLVFVHARGEVLHIGGILVPHRPSGLLLAPVIGVSIGLERGRPRPCCPPGPRRPSLAYRAPWPGRPSWPWSGRRSPSAVGPDGGRLGLLSPQAGRIDVLAHLVHLGVAGLHVLGLSLQLGGPLGDRHFLVEVGPTGSPRPGPCASP